MFYKRVYDILRITGSKWARSQIVRQGLTTHPLQQFSTARVNLQENEGLKLFTPGPLCTSMAVKQAMTRDLGSRDTEFLDTVVFIRQTLLEIAGVSAQDYTVILLQGSGTYAVEAIFQTTVPRSNEKVLIISGGSYGDRLAKICSVMGLSHDIIRYKESEKVDLNTLRSQLLATTYSNVAVIHCETSSGVVNPVEDVGRVVKEVQPEAVYIVDAMSSFGAIPVDIRTGNIDYLISSANKCIEGVPGFGFVLAKKSQLTQCKGQSRSLSLDLYDQYTSMEADGMFRFTPPTHTLLAFKQALIEFVQQQGVEGRAARYKENHRILCDGMRRLGFKEFLSNDHKGYIITSFHYPDDDNFQFDEFYNRLRDMGQVLYPGKVSQADCFRIGNIGQLYSRDMEHLVQCIESVCQAMGVALPVRYN